MCDSPIFKCMLRMLIKIWQKKSHDMVKQFSSLPAFDEADYVSFTELQLIYL